MSNEKDKKNIEEMLNGVSDNETTEARIDSSMSEDNSKSETVIEENKDADKEEKAADNNSEKNQKKDGKLKALFKSRKMRKGGLSIAFTAVFIVAVIVLNMIAGLITNKVPALSFDLSSQQTYNLTQDTIDFVETINKDITISVLASESDYTGASQYYLMASTLLNQYKNYNDKIKIEYIDLTANPTYINNYPDDTLQQGNYIVKCGEKYRILTNDDLFETQMSSDYSSYEVTGLNVEPAVTTAILNVTSENQVKVQFIEGFGNYNADAFKNLLEQNNYDVSTVSTLTEYIDKDAEALVLFTPTTDLDETSVKKIKEFLNNNGNYGKDLMYVAAATPVEAPNLDALLEEWGMKMSEGVVAEMDSSKLLSSNDPFTSVLEYNNTDYTDGLKDSSLYIVGGEIVPVEISDENTATSLLVTSASAKLYPFTADENFKIDDVKEQQFNAAAIATKTSGDNTASNVIVMGSSLIFNSNAIKMSSYNNGAYLMNMMNKVTENTDEGITISGKDLSSPSLGITSDQIQLWTIICMGVFPVAIIIVAIVVYIRRRNK